MAPRRAMCAASRCSQLQHAAAASAHGSRSSTTPSRAPSRAWRRHSSSGNASACATLHLRLANSGARSTPALPAAASCSVAGVSPAQREEFHSMWLRQLLVLTHTMRRVRRAAWRPAGSSAPGALPPALRTRAASARRATAAQPRRQQRRTRAQRRACAAVSAAAARTPRAAPCPSCAQCTRNEGSRAGGGRVGSYTFKLFARRNTDALLL
jgi:hypothetical protein